MTEGQPWLDEVLDYLAGNRDYLHQHASDNWSRAPHYAPEATYLGWFDFRPYDLQPSSYAFFLERAKVALGNGARFGDPGRGFVRLNFATSRNILAQITDRMDRALDEANAS